MADEQRPDESTGDRRRRAGLSGLLDKIYALREAGSPERVGRWDQRHHKAQVVSVRRRQFDPAAVEVAAVFPLPEGRYRHRRVRCSGSDLDRGLAFPLFNPGPDCVVRGGGRSVPLWVQDQDFDTLEEAFQAAERHEVPADPDGWLTPMKFQTKVQGLESLRPEAERIGELGRVIVGVASFTAFGAVYVAAAWLVPDLFSVEDEVVYSTVLVALLALPVAAIVWGATEDLLSRRHLALEIAGRGSHDGVPGNAPREPGATSRGHSATRIQDGPSDDHLLDAGSVDHPQDTPDTSTPQDD